ncbi:hypothetical protein M8J77_010859 [Diaphorina citri]|nr:hypothetical protein M8J77_010859 [Diaphorina citri]
MDNVEEEEADENVPMGPRVSLSFTEPPSLQSTDSGFDIPDVAPWGSPHSSLTGGENVPSSEGSIQEIEPEEESPEPPYYEPIKKVCPPMPTDLPRSYQQNNLKETILIGYFCRAFIRQCGRRFPHRKLPVLTIPNEFGVPKMVCTTVNMSQIPFKDFMTWEGTAKYLADHVVYTPLDKPTEPPDVLRAPNTVLASQSGNCLEFSNLLVSLLLGINVNAYVVWGYAKRRVCQNDMSTLPCPVSLDIPEENKDANDTDNLDELLANSKYQFDPDKNRDFESKTDKLERQRKQEEKEREKKELEEKRKRRAERLEKRLLNPPDELHGYRVHSWVLIIEKEDKSIRSPKRSSQSDSSPVRSKMSREKSRIPSNIMSSSKSRSSSSRGSKGKNIVWNAFFIEPSTGTRHEISDESYLGIEAVWNNVNYWFNKQTCVNGCAELTFNLTDRQAWQRLLKYRRQRIPLAAFSLKQFTNRIVGSEKKVKPKVGFTLPFTWTVTVNLNLCKYLSERYGGENNVRRTRYYKTVVERYSELHQPEGTVTRMNKFMDIKYKVPDKKVERYENRRDQMSHRQVTYPEQSVEEHFQLGRSDALKMFQQKQTEREFEIRLEFFADERPDRMKSLYIQGNNDIVHITYEGRSDFIREVYGETSSARVKDKSQSDSELKTASSESVELDIDKLKDLTPYRPNAYGSRNQSSIHHNTGIGSGDSKSSTPQKTDKEKEILFAYIIYDRNPAKPCDQDVERVLFFDPIDHIEIEHHYDELDIVMTRKTITRSQYFDQKQANKYLKIYPRDPYEEQNPHFVQSTELIQHFKAVQRDIRLRIDQCKSLVRKILLDRTEGKMGRQVDKLLPTESLLESNPLLHKQHKMEEKIAKKLKFNPKPKFSRKIIMNWPTSFGFDDLCEPTGKRVEPQKPKKAKVDSEDFKLFIQSAQECEEGKSSVLGGHV